MIGGQHLLRGHNAMQNNMGDMCAFYEALKAVCGP